jgi:hypothetical protein
MEFAGHLRRHGVEANATDRAVRGKGNWRKKDGIYRAALRGESTQADVDAWMESYNAERTHSGKYCYGKTPMQTFINSAKLAYDRQLDRIQPISEPAEEAM